MQAIESQNPPIEKYLLSNGAEAAYVRTKTSECSADQIISFTDLFEAKNKSCNFYKLHGTVVHGLFPIYYST
ncbi:hypothetical protein BH09BAC5_BH09BAC5_21840 [soil metagenome]